MKLDYENRHKLKAWCEQLSLATKRRDLRVEADEIFKELMAFIEDPDNSDIKRAMCTHPKYNTKQGVCPVCKADSHITYSYPHENDPESVYYHVDCQNCGATWDEHYDLMYQTSDNIQEPKN